MALSGSPPACAALGGRPIRQRAAQAHPRILDSPALFVRRTLWGGFAAGCVACVALAVAGPPGWGAGAAVGAAVALGNFWLLARAVVRLGGGERGPQVLRGAAWRGAALRFTLAGAALVLALLVLPVHPFGVAAGLVGVHVAMTAMWMAASLAGIGSSPTPPES